MTSAQEPAAPAPGSRSNTEEQLPRLPALLRGRRRRYLAGLVLSAAVHTAVAVTAGLLVGRMLGGHPSGPRMAAELTVFAVCIIGTALSRYAERVLAERLGQDYVHQLRLGLLRHALTADAPPSLGITIARSTNDLTSVRTWVSMGIAPVIALTPLTAGSLILLWSIHWALALAVAVPLALLTAALMGLARILYGRARRLRRHRGRLAAHIADVVSAADGVIVAGGVERELRGVDRTARRLIEAAVHRAGTAGLLRGLAATVPLLAGGTVAALGALGEVHQAAAATALTVIGILSAPISDLGRLVEYRQTYRAARRVIGPLLTDAAQRGAAASTATNGDSAHAGAPRERPLVHARGLTAGSATLPELRLAAGDRVRLALPAPDESSGVVRRLAAPPPGSMINVWIDGIDVAESEPTVRRSLVGLAAHNSYLERGTVARAVRYRRPDLPDEAGISALHEIGLGPRLAELPDGPRTVLKSGGEPLRRSERARLQLARATLGTPPLLIVDRLDADLDEDGIDLLRHVVDAYPGAVLFVSDQPERVAARWRTWPLPDR